MNIMFVSVQGAQRSRSGSAKLSAPAAARILLAIPDRASSSTVPRAAASLLCPWAPPPPPRLDLQPASFSSFSPICSDDARRYRHSELVLSLRSLEICSAILMVVGVISGFVPLSPRHLSPSVASLRYECVSHPRPRQPDSCTLRGAPSRFHNQLTRRARRICTMRGSAAVVMPCRTTRSDRSCSVAVFVWLTRFECLPPAVPRETRRRGALHRLRSVSSTGAPRRMPARRCPACFERLPRVCGRIEIVHPIGEHPMAFVSTPV